MTRRRDDTPEEPAPAPFGINCPNGGIFYNGVKSAFLGCCAVDPAANNGECPPNMMTAASFDPADYSKILKQECADDSAQWWTCAGIKPPFMGCCTVNACNLNGCPLSNLRAAKLNSDPELAKPFLDPSFTPAAEPTASSSSSSSASPTVSVASSRSSTSSGATSSSPTSSSPSSTTSSSSSSSPSSGGHQGLQTGAVIGLAIGTAAGVSIIAFLLFWLVRRKRASNPRHDYATPGTPSFAGDSKSVAPSPATPQWGFNHSEPYGKSVPYQTLQQNSGNEGRYSVPPEYSAVMSQSQSQSQSQSPAPTELPGSARTAVFELHDTSPEMRGGSGFGPR